MIRVFHLKTCFTGLGLVLGLLATALSAKADFFADYTVNGSYGESYTWGTVNYSSTSYNYWAGAITWTTTNPNQYIPGLTNHSGVFNAFCIDLTQDAASPEKFNAQSLSSTLPVANAASKAQYIEALWAEHNPSSFTSNLQYAAFQLALWEIEYDTPTNGPNSNQYQITSGDGSGFFMTGTALTPSNDLSTAMAAQLANYWLLNIALSDAGKVNLVGLYGENGTQDMVVQLPPGFGPTPNGEISATPAPPALILALVGIVPCLALRRRLVGAKVA